MITRILMIFKLLLEKVNEYIKLELKQMKKLMRFNSVREFMIIKGT